MSAGVHPLASRFLRLAARTVSPGGEGRLSILIYHRVFETPDPLLDDVPDARRFDAQMEALGVHFNVLPLGEAVERLARRSLPPRAACVTFDDGYRDNVEVALPILVKHRVPATFFIAPGFLDGGRMFNDTVIEAVRDAQVATLDLSFLGLGSVPVGTMDQKRRAIAAILKPVRYLSMGERQRLTERLATDSKARLPVRLMMDSAQVRWLADAGMEVGGHTLNHPILARLDRDAARKEIADGRERLEALIGRRVTLFAYPNGMPETDYSPEHVTMVRELGFAAAVSTSWGVATADSDFFQLPRFTPWDQSPARFVARLIHNCWARRPQTVSPERVR